MTEFTDAPALVLLPGMDGTGTLFSEFVAALGSNVRIVVISYPSNEALGYAKLQTYVRDRLPADRPYAILGESFSGPIAISIAASAPSHLTALILSCSFAKAPHPALVAMRWLISFLPDVMPSKLVHWALLGQSATSELQGRLDQALRLVPAPILRARLKAIAEIDVSQQLRRLKLPILYMRAAHDRVVTRSASKLISRAAPQTQTIEISGPHMLLQTQPRIAADAVIEFLSGRGSRHQMEPSTATAAES